MPRNPVTKCEVSWEDRYGTTSSGNLPQRVLYECLENTIDLAVIQTIFPWVSLEDFNFYHVKCPFTSESSPEQILHFVRRSEERRVGKECTG
jgi:hypothetical protein